MRTCYFFTFIYTNDLLKFWSSIFFLKIRNVIIVQAFFRAVKIDFKMVVVGVGDMEHWKVFSTTMIGWQDKYSNFRRPRMAKAIILTFGKTLDLSCFDLALKPFLFCLCCNLRPPRFCRPCRYLYFPVPWPGPCSGRNLYLTALLQFVFSGPCSQFVFTSPC